MGQQTIYVDGLGFIPIVSGQTPQDAIASAQQKRGTSGVGGLLNSPGQPFDNTLGPGDEGPQQSPMSGQDLVMSMIKVVPQLAGLLLSRGGAGMAFGVPALTDVGTQALTKGVDEIDPMQSIGQGTLGLGAHGVGRSAPWLVKQGGEKVVKALGLQGASDPTIKSMQNLAIKEGARLTEASEDAIRAKAVNTASGGLEELADTMGAARRADATAPSRITFWPQEAAANYVRRAPRQMSIGQNMVNAGTELAKLPMEAVARILAMISQVEQPKSASGPKRRTP